MRRLALAIPLILAAPALGAGTVGSGTPGSCDEPALNAALGGGGSVTFNCGGGPVTIPITATKTITAPTPTVIDGGGLVTLDGQDAVRLFYLDYQRQMTLQNITLRRGRVTDRGAAVRSHFHEFGTPALTADNVTFEDNVTTDMGNDVGGGALFLQGGVSTITNSRFLRNRGGNGGAIGFLGSDTAGVAHNALTILDTTFADNATQPRNGANQGGAGGAIYVDGSGDGEVHLERCAFRNNTAAGFGGAVHGYFYGAPQTLLIDRCTFLENVASGGNAGAVYHQAGILTITQSLFAGNRCFEQGGALWVYDPRGATVTNSTFTGNRAIGAIAPAGYASGGGLVIYPSGPNVTLAHLTVAGNHADWTAGGIGTGNQFGPSSWVTLRASIVANNTASNGGNPWNIGKNCGTDSGMMTNGGDVIEYPQRNLSAFNDYNCVAAPAIAEPRLGPLANHGGTVATVSLLPGSPAIDAAFAGCASAVDGRGAARPAGVRCDVGSFEGTEGPTLFHPLTPCRVLDTRLGAAVPVAANGSLTFDVLGICGVPSTARSVAVNLTGVNPTADGLLRLWNAGAATPTPQVLALRTGRTRAVNAVAAPGGLGRLTVRNESAQPVHVVLDASGWFE